MVANNININQGMIKENFAYKTNSICFGNVKPTPTKILPFNESIKKNFNFTKYNKLDTNISVLKIVAIILVVLTHTIQSSLGLVSANGGSIVSLYNQMGGNIYWLHFFQTLAIPSVNIFVVVSCFLENKSFKIKLYKLIKMYFLITFILLMMTLLKWCIWPTKISIKEWFSSVLWFFVEDPWYFTAYLCFLLLVPFFNYLFRKLSKKGIDICFGIVILIFVIWKILTMLFGTSLWDESAGLIRNLLGNEKSWWMPNIHDIITNRGYNFLNFFVIYVIVQWIISHNFFDKLKWYVWSLIYLFTFCLQYLLIVWTYSNMVYEYSNPLVILLAISLFGWFYNIKMKKNEYINYLATLTMLIFLFHWNPLGKTFLAYNSANSDLGNIWVSSIMRDLLYKDSIFLFGVWVAATSLWPIHILLVFIMLLIALLMIAIIFDLICKLFISIPYWQIFIDWNKSFFQLERFENPFIS